MPFLLVLAVIPVGVLLFIIFKIDKHEKEPIGLLISLFFLGVVAVIPVFIAELIMEAYFTVNLDTSSYYFYFCEAFFVAGLCEEGLKYFFLRIRTWNHKAFNYRFDAIVYSVFVSLGLACLENILYVCTNGFAVGSFRAIVSVPGHCFYGVFMGYYYALTKHNDNIIKIAKGQIADIEYQKTNPRLDSVEKGRLVGLLENKRMSIEKFLNARIKYSVLSLVVPITLHGFFDFCIFTENVIFYLIFLVFVVLLYIFTIKRIIKARKEDVPIAVPVGGVPYESANANSAPSSPSTQPLPPITPVGEAPMPVWDSNSYDNTKSPFVPLKKVPSVVIAQPTIPIASETYASTPKPSPKYCIHCGAPLFPEFRFCEECGKRISR